jgi:hypothetical protein
VSTIDTSAFRGLFSMHMVVPQLDLLIRPEKIDHALTSSRRLFGAVRACTAYTCVHPCGGGTVGRGGGRPANRRTGGRQAHGACTCMHACMRLSYRPSHPARCNRKLSRSSPCVHGRFCVRSHYSTLLECPAACI